MDSGGMEAVGEAVTGAAAARVVEPSTGEVQEGREGACLNCGTPLAGPYCHACGQPAHVHRTVAAWWHDLAHGVLHFEGKVWRTLPLLAWRPGELTRRYIEGERARFVSPLALFLFSVFLMFAAMGSLGGGFNPDTSGVERGLGEQVRAEEAALGRIEAERSAALAAHRPTADIDRRLEEAREELSLVRTMRDRGLVRGSGIRVSDDVPEWIAQGIRKASANPSLMIYKLQSNGYKFSWALIPLSVPFLWLLFLHRRRYRRHYKAYDHLVFVTYSIAFMSLALVGIVLLRAVGVKGAPLAFLIFALPPAHIYRQLRGAYRLSRPSAAWRTVALLFFATCALSLFMLLLAASIAH
ncbi:MAG: DUF3667 domain-containing protein [Alphaproteobacteria bacterium]|nr:DUF3667 domain-containing protein [Alphaproteobacteria bacterium]MBV9372999.1 DUF3667 domain-containing protein [Alphaproteobacteria bacterium]MBV9901366.1 DUF3667 domain-containing protein [Alphaproteobacteria bacterium]